MVGRSLDTWVINLYSKLKGDLKEGYYYQTYFQIPSKAVPGTYEAFTCTSEYRRNQNMDDYIKNYETENDFTASNVYGNYLYQNN